ncbi:hypothetical protein [Winogradskya humida]|uniref:Uncharacterized protein n=1 Tax=Winogradskya humida TaxID=113566 RepID=A0ABQ4A059_9ACTN|nr:hypothetical protein [Actinoplanes humidus]GIE24223.1 hypothetical protein Ahu01nite_073250 [Actinoplanes humidus]
MDADGNNHHAGGGPGGEGGSVVRRFLTSPTALPESLAPATLLTISLVLSVALVGLATIALAP